MIRADHSDRRSRSRDEFAGYVEEYGDETIAYEIIKADHEDALWRHLMPMKSHIKFDRLLVLYDSNGKMNKNSFYLKYSISTVGGRE